MVYISMVYILFSGDKTGKKLLKAALNAVLQLLVTGLGLGFIIITVVYSIMKVFSFFLPFSLAWVFFI